MPKIAEIEPTPNPNAMKFVLREPLTWGITRSYDSADEAKDDPLAARLFQIAHVVNVFYVDHWITVTQDGSADWQELMRKLAVPIRDAPGADSASEQFARQAATIATADGMSEADRERLDRINALLDEQVRPYLQGDGGDLYVVALEGNTLSVHYQGACGSCPSSISGTLIGIENLLRQIEPEIEVVAA
jgi:Fe-S cluster biogenesis protein NfuA